MGIDLGGSKMSVEFLKTDKAPAAIGPYSQAGKVGNLIFVSGQKLQHLQV